MKFVESKGFVLNTLQVARRTLVNVVASGCFDRYRIVYNRFLACAHIGHSDTLVGVRVIARGTLREFVETLKGTKNHTPVKTALDAWFHEAEAASWKNPAEVKAAYANASIVGNDRVVFNIKGNSFRLVVALDYLRQVVYIKAKVSYAGKSDQK
ncbi:MAG: type II toxin-antitoxin system HigB family toxin [Terracidiphilus sp.]